MAEHLLVVDDNPSNLKLACDVLESEGHRVERANSAETALASIARSAPALILLDIALPRMDGLELTRKLKADPATKAIPIVVMTAYAMKGDEEKARAAGCDGYLSKPIDTRALPGQVRDYLAGTAARMPKRLLIVDDVASNRKLLRVTLESEGFSVIEAADGLEALEILNGTAVDAVIADILMPNMDGYRLCYEIRSSERWFKLPVIIYTNTYTSEGDERAALELGADRYLRKPAPPRAIADALRDAVASSSKRTHTLIQQPEGLELLKSYSGRLVAKLEDRNLELRQRTEALSESNRLFTELTSHLPEVFWLASVDRKQVFYVSPAYESVFGSSSRQLLERPESWLALVHPEDRPRVEEAVRNSAQGAGYHQEYRIFRPGGGTVWIEERAFPIRDEMGNPTRLAGLAEDVTERRTAKEKQERLEAELRQAQKLEAIGTLAAGIAHDFNNIVTAIIGNSELACVHLASDHPARENVHRILEAGQRAVDLIRQILTFSRNQSQPREAISLNPIIIEVVELLRGSLPVNIGIRAGLSDQLPLVVANASQIHQVLMNVCSNAAHAMAESGGVISIHAQVVSANSDVDTRRLPLPSGNYLRVDVADSGHGMDAATLARVFERFFTTKRDGSGTGLGLSVVHDIMRDHHGTAIAESQVGKGTTIRLFFPIWTGELASPLPPAPLARGRGEKLLVVGDEGSMTLLAANSLETLGYRVSPFTTAESALSTFRSTPHEFDLVISDLHTSGLSGVEFASRVRRLRVGIPVLVTARELQAAERDALRGRGLREVLIKPFSLELLSEAVRRALDERDESRRA